MADPDSTRQSERRIRASLSRLAGDPPELVVRRAAEAVDDIDAAAAFVAGTDLETLAAAIEQLEDRQLERRGREALASFRRFERAAAGESPTSPATPVDDDHFHRARGSDLRGAAEPTGE